MITLSKTQNDKNNNTYIAQESENIYKLNDEYTMLLDEKIGAGAFGQIYKCQNVKTKEIYAGKIESITSISPQLYHEYKILTEMKGKFGFPNCYKLINTKQDRTLIMDFLGPNLESIMNKMPNQKFSMKTSLMITEQIIQRLKELHAKFFLHPDMKPENFVIGQKGKERTIYLIDFGLSRKYINERTLEHIPLKDKRPILGTVRYISINTHLGFEQSRRDDLESLSYIMIYFIMGELPWQCIKSKTKKEKYDKILLKKKETVPNEICKFLPEEIKLFFSHILQLDFTDRPDYAYLTSLLDKLMSKYGYSNDLQFDWYTPAILTVLYDAYNAQMNNSSNGQAKEREDDKNNLIKKTMTNVVTKRKENSHFKTNAGVKNSYSNNKLVFVGFNNNNK